MAGLYIHIPFCHAKCWYCDFYSLATPRRAAGFVDALEVEWNLRRNEIAPPATIYVGGGTPSILSPEAVRRMRSWLPVASGEFTVEMNPEDVSVEVVDAWKLVGINRVSMGVQSLNNDELRGVGRRHTADEAVAAYNILRQCGIDNISLDLIIGLPGQTRASLADSVTRLLDLGPQHFSAYILSYEHGTRLWARRRAGRITETDDDTIAAMYDDVCRAARSYGYDHYEVSNFALPGYWACHNAAYWADEPYLGLGPAAHSFDSKIRRINPSDLGRWSAAIENGRTAYEIDDESDVDRINDRIMVALRTSHGLDLDLFEPDVRRQIERNLALLPDGRITRRQNRLIIPENAWLLSDDTIATLFV